jgi:hypothetical protein
MSTTTGGDEDGNGCGDRGSSHYERKNTTAAPDPKKVSTLGRGMHRYLQGKTTDANAREEPPWDALYAPSECIIIC